MPESRERHAYPSNGAAECQTDKTREEPCHFMIMKTLTIQNKESILKAAQEKWQAACKRRPSRVTADVSTETKAGRLRRMHFKL